MKAGAAKSRPEWRSCRETNEGRQMKAGAARMEITKGNKLHRHRPQIALSRASFKNGQTIAKKEGRQAGEGRRQRQPRPAQNGGHGERRMTRRPRQPKANQTSLEILKTRRQRHHDHFGIFGISNPVIGSKNPIASSYLGKKKLTLRNKNT